jgi:hypothetical protein
LSLLGTKHALSPVRLKAQNPTDNRRSALDVQSAQSRHLVLILTLRCGFRIAAIRASRNIFDGWMTAERTLWTLGFGWPNGTPGPVRPLVWGLEIGCSVELLAVAKKPVSCFGNLGRQGG